MFDEPSTRPHTADVLPAATVEQLAARSERELEELRHELEVLLREADAAEQRLAANPIASMYDEAFEADVLARTYAITQAGPAVQIDATRESLQPPQDGASTARHALDLFSLVPPMHSPSTSNGTLNPPPASSSELSSLRRPRTVVVDRSHPSADSAPTVPPSSLPPPPDVSSAYAPAIGLQNGASTAASFEFSAPVVDPQSDAPPPARFDERVFLSPGTDVRLAEDGPQARKLGARLSIYVGVIVVIAALIILKFG